MLTEGPIGKALAEFIEETLKRANSEKTLEFEQVQMLSTLVGTLAVARQNGL